MICFTIVVFPALSSPLVERQPKAPHFQDQIPMTYSIKIRISLSLKRAFRRIESIAASRGEILVVRDGKSEISKILIFACLESLGGIATY